VARTYAASFVYAAAVAGYIAVAEGAACDATREVLEFAYKLLAVATVGTQ
jgi:hypothetical protein